MSQTNPTGTCLAGTSSCKTLLSLMLKLDWKRWLGFGMTWDRRVPGLKDSATSCTSNSVTTATLNTLSSSSSMQPWMQIRLEWTKSRCRCCWITGMGNLAISTKRKHHSRHSKMFLKGLMICSSSQRNATCPYLEFTCTHMAPSWCATIKQSGKMRKKLLSKVASPFPNTAKAAARASEA